MERVSERLLADNPGVKPKLEHLFRQHLDLLSDDGVLRLLQQREVQHRIDEVPGSRPRAQNPYRLSPPH
eukprot:2298976-Rhodomonas_salina.1